MKISFFVLACVLLFSGCASFYTAQYTEMSYPCVDPESIRVFQGIVDRPFIKLGEVSAEGSILSRWSSIRRRLKEEAAKMGGNAIILTDVFMTRYSKEIAADHTADSFIPLNKKSVSAIVIRLSE